MLEQFKAMGAVAGLLKNREKLREASDRVREKIASMRVEGSAGGGAVRVRLSGRSRVESVTLEAPLASTLGQAGAKAHAERLIAEAVNDALGKAEQILKEELAREAKALGLDEIPGLQEALTGGGLI
ncbi:MAG: YbaB/EbfC family nucleoid-associated protein [Phycisphaerales bacterium]